MKKVSENALIVILIIVFVVSLALIMVQVKQNPSSINQTSLSNPKAQRVVPIDPNNKSVALLLLSYSLNGIVKNISQLGSGIKIDINTNSASSLPQFLIESNAQIVKIDPSGNQDKGTLTEVKKGDSVNVAALYDMKSKKWTVTRLTIFVKTLLKVTPTGAANVSISPKVTP